MPALPTHVLPRAHYSDARPPEQRTETHDDWPRGFRRALNRGIPRRNRTLVALVAFTVVLTAAILVWPTVAPLTGLVVPLLLGSILLSPRQLPWFVVFLMVMLMLAIGRQQTIEVRTVIAIAILYLLCFIVLVTSFRRTRLGVAGVLGESMLVDLRDRIQQQGGIPPPPPVWLVETALRSAGGTLFAGDFVVATRPRHSNRLEIAPRGRVRQGEQAGTRALLLSGAFGGLPGALPPEDFLPAANDHPLRQAWAEGFATAVHLSSTSGPVSSRSERRPSAGGAAGPRAPGAGPSTRQRGLSSPDRGRRLHGRLRGRPARRRPAALHRRAGRDPAPRDRPGDRPDAGQSERLAARHVRGWRGPVGRGTGLGQRRPRARAGAPTPPEAAPGSAPVGAATRGVAP